MQVVQFVFGTSICVCVLKPTETAGRSTRGGIGRCERSLRRVYKEDCRVREEASDGTTGKRNYEEDSAGPGNGKEVRYLLCCG